MTNERAVQLLSQMFLIQFNEEEHEALAMAIDALGKEPNFGKWINDTHYPGWTCSKCNYHDGNKTDRYCPSCGTRMERNIK